MNSMMFMCIFIARNIGCEGMASKFLARMKTKKSENACRDSDSIDEDHDQRKADAKKSEKSSITIRQ